MKIVVQWQVPKSTDTVIQHFGQAGCNSSIQAVAILIAEKGYFSKLRVKKRKAEFEASFHTNLKHKDSTISSIPLKCVALGECGNIHYSQPLIMDTSPSSDIPHPDPNTINTDIPRASEVGDMSGGNKELQDDDDDDIEAPTEVQGGEPFCIMEPGEHIGDQDHLNNTKVVAT